MEIDAGDLNHNNHHHDTANPDHVMVYVSQPDPKPQNSAAGAVPPAKTKTLRRLPLSKPKARFAESGETVQLLNPVISSDDNRSLSSDDDDDEEWFKDENDADGAAEQTSFLRRRRRKTKHKRVVIEFVLFIIILVCLICSLTVKSLKNQILWGLEVWKWCLIVMVLFSGRLVSVWLVGVLVFFIERNFMLREKVLYFVYGLRRSFQNCVWLALVLFCWMIMFRDVHKRNNVARMIFLGLVAVLVGATIWLLKIVLVKVLASSFHVATFFDRMKESVFNHYILETLSGPRLEEEEEVELEVEVKAMRPGRAAEGGRRMRKFKTMSSRMAPERSESKRKIDMERLRKLSRQRRPTAWTVKRLVNYVKSSGLSMTISRTVDDFKAAEEGINSEWEARMAAQRIFKNVAKPGAKYIEEEDLLRFLKSDEVFTVFPLFEGALETGRITKSSLRNWVFQAYVERKALAHSLNDTKTAVQQLHRLASAVVSILIIVVSLLIMGLATINIVFFITTQMLVVGFVFQNSCKTVFECIIFVFVMHPFDVGDRCVIDGVQMIVEEMNILSTVFLRYDMEKIYYPNSVLITKPISNFRRSPDMGDSVEFTIDVSTPLDDINALKRAIQWYIESKPKYWVPKHSVLFKEIENMDKMKMILCVQHTMNHQNFGEKSARRSELVLELKKIFENHGIKYHLLPQQVHLTQLINNHID